MASGNPQLYLDPNFCFSGLKIMILSRFLFTSRTLLPFTSWHRISVTCKRRCNKKLSLVSADSLAAIAVQAPCGLLEESGHKAVPETASAPLAGDHAAAGRQILCDGRPS